MSKPIINGIDVSECRHHYTNPVNGTIYHGCAIYEQINELGYSQDTLCEQNPNCYFKQLKRLQEENEKQKEQIKQFEDFIKSAGEIDYINHEYTYKLKKENKKLREEIYATRNNRLKMYESFETECNKYKQALEEIRKEANRLLYEENPIYGYNNSNYFELLAKYVLAKIKEVLNDRD